MQLEAQAGAAALAETIQAGSAMIAAESQAQPVSRYLLAVLWIPNSQLCCHSKIQVQTQPWSAAAGYDLLAVQWLPE